jgi:hypothetical protein
MEVEEITEHLYIKTPVVKEPTAYLQVEAVTPERVQVIVVEEGYMPVTSGGDVCMELEDMIPNAYHNDQPWFGESEETPFAHAWEGKSFTVSKDHFNQHYEPQKVDMEVTTK